MTPADALRELAAPVSRGESVKTLIQRSARLCGLSYWRAFDIWYSKARRIEPDERTAIDDAVTKKRARGMRNDINEIMLRIAKIEAALSAKDEESFRPTIQWNGEVVGET